jgi:Flp pilus assembly protein TadB
VAAIPRGVTFGCGAASIVALILLAGAGAWMASGGIVDFMDLVFGMSMGEVRGMYASTVSSEDKKELEDAVETLRGNLRSGKITVAALDPVLQTMRKGIADKKMDPAEVRALTAAAKKAGQPPPKPGPR